MEASSCTSENQCQLTVRYTEGSSWTAYEHVDTLWFDKTQHGAPVHYGCQFYESGLFRKQHEDGILGLAMNDQMITSTYKQHRSIEHNSFSICLNHSSKETKGYFTLGGTKNTKMEFTPIIPNPNGWYVIRIESLLIGQQPLGTSNFMRDTKQTILQSFHKNKGTIIDSGTTDIYLPVGIAPFFIRVWESITKKQYTNEPMLLTYKEYTEIPNVTLVLQGGYHWVLRPKYYLEPTDKMEEKWEGKKAFVNRIYLTEPSGAVLGVNAMMGHEIYFDIENQRIGFADSDCQ